MEAKAPSPVPGDQRTRPPSNLASDWGPLIPRTRDAGAITHQVAAKALTLARTSSASEGSPSRVRSSPPWSRRAAATRHRSTTSATVVVGLEARRGRGRDRVEGDVVAPAGGSGEHEA